jgi:protein SCO1/2
VIRAAAAAAVVLAVAFSAVGCGEEKATQSIDHPPTTTGKSEFRGAELPDAEPAPDFSLRDQDGKLVRLSDQRGKYVLLTFLYTNCPDVCPLIATNLNAALQQLGAKRDDVRVLAVSVDPKGDTPKAVREYVRARHLLPQFRYLIGTPSQLHTVWAKYNVAAVRRDPAIVDHVAYTVVIDPDGKRRVIYDSGVKAPQVVHDLHVLMRKSEAA